MRIGRLFISAMIFSLFVIILHTLVYGSILTKLTEASLSNSLFVVGVLAFFPTLALRVGSANLFIGFRYSIYRFVYAGKIREYGTFSEYASGKKVTPQGGVVNEILLISLIAIIASYVIILN